MQHVESPDLHHLRHEYPVVFEVERPARYDRAQVALRLAILMVLGVLSAPVGWLFGVLFLALPVVAAVEISTRGPGEFLSGPSAQLVRTIRWVLSFYAYLALLTDRFPQFSAPASLIRFEVTPTGAPTVGSALLRLLTSIPYAAVLFVLGVATGFIWVVSLVAIVVGDGVPKNQYDFLRGVMRWQARLLAYHSSLIEEYPPWSFDTEPSGPGATAAVR